MRIRWTRLVAGLLATTAVGVCAVEINANLAARATLQALLARNPDIHVTSVFAEPVTGRLTLGGVKAKHGSLQIRIGRLDLPLQSDAGLIDAAVASPFDDKTEAPSGIGPLKSPDDVPSPPPPAASAPAPTPAPATQSAGTATAQDVVITNGTLTYHIRQIDLTGTNLSNADLMRLLDQKSTQTLEARVRQLNASTITIPEVISEDPTIGSERHSTITQIQLSGVVAGRIGSGTVATTTFSGHSGNTQVIGSAGPVSFSGLDLAQILHMSSTVRTDDSEPLAPMLDTLTASNIKITNETTKTVIDVASFKESGVRGRSLRSTMFVRPGVQLTPAESRAALDDLVRSVSFASFDVEGISGHHTEGDNAQGTFGLASINVHDFGAGHLGGFAMRNLYVDTPDAKFKFATFEIGAFTIPSQEQIASGDIKGFPQFTTAALNDLVLDVPSKTGGPSIKLNVRRVSVANDGDSGEIPKSGLFSMENLVFDVLPNVPQMQPFAQMGYQHLDLSFGLATTYDAPAQSLSIHDVKLQGANMGSVTLSLLLANVTKGLVSKNPEIVKAAAMSILAKSLSLDLLNGGFIDRVIAWRAKQDGVDVPKEKQSLIDLVTSSAPPELQQKPGVKAVIGALTKFIAEPKSLHLGVTSKIGGLGAGAVPLFSDPSALIDTLDIQASANQ